MLFSTRECWSLLKNKSRFKIATKGVQLWVSTPRAAAKHVGATASCLSLSLLVIRHFVPWIPGGVRSLNTGLNHTGGSQWLRPPVSLRTASCSFHSPSIPRVTAHHRAPETILALSNCRPLFSRGGITLTLNYLFHFLALDIEKLRHLQTKPWFD